MILISHRGNLNGKNKERENEPLYIIEATEKGYDVEIDVWWKEDRFYLGHDEPYYKVNINFLQNRKFWCHAKNIEALDIDEDAVRAAQSNAELNKVRYFTEKSPLLR